jgi:hypothetical protein
VFFISTIGTGAALLYRSPGEVGHDAYAVIRETLARSRSISGSLWFILEPARGNYSIAAAGPHSVRRVP